MNGRNLLQQAKLARQQGNKTEARRLLQTAARRDPQNYAVWLWLASVASSPQTALTYIERAAKLNPDHPSIPKARAWAQEQLEQQQAAQDKTPPPAQKRPLWLWATLALIIVVSLGLLAFAWNTRGSADGGETAVAAPVRSQPIVDGRPSPQPQATATPTAQPLLAKAVAAGNDPRPTWTMTPTPTKTPTPSPTPEPTFVSNNSYTARPLGVGPNERWVDVNLTTQTLTAYEGDIPVMQTLISSGLRRYPTVTGQFRIWLRFESQTMDGRRLGYDYYLEDVPYVMYFFEDYALHGTYWHNNFGTPMSHGCVNMETGDAQWLFNWAEVGTLVNVHY